MKIKNFIFIIIFCSVFSFQFQSAHATTEDTIPPIEDTVPDLSIMTDQEVLDYLDSLNTPTTTVPPCLYPDPGCQVSISGDTNWVMYDPDPPCVYPDPGCQVSVDDNSFKFPRLKVTKMQTTTIIICFSLIILMIIYTIYKRNHIKALQDYEFKMMEFEHRARLEENAAELEKFKVHELSKDQLEKDYEVKLKQVEYDKFVEDRNFMMTVTKEERDFMLKQRELEIKDRQNQNQLMNIIEENKDVQLRIKK